MSGHGQGGAGLEGKRKDARCAAGLKLQLFRKGGHSHAPGGVSPFRSGASIADVLNAGIGVGGASNHLLFFAVPPSVGDYAVSRGKSSGWNGGGAEPGFRG